MQPRKRSEQALVSVVQPAYVCCVSMRRVDQLVESLGLRIPKSEISRIAGLRYEQVCAFSPAATGGPLPVFVRRREVEKWTSPGSVDTG